MNANEMSIEKISEVTKRAEESNKIEEFSTKVNDVTEKMLYNYVTEK